MRVVVQRVSQASVTIESKIVSEIENGILALIGVEKDDTTDDAAWMAEKIANLRIFEDSAGKMNLSVADAGGAVLAVSQFTLAGNCAKGRRPSFDTAAHPDMACNLYEFCAEKIRNLGVPVKMGVFQATMQVQLINDGPVTFILESPRKKQADSR